MLVTIVAAFAIAACNTFPPILKPTPQVVATRYTAMMIGKLVLVDDCLRVNSIYSNESELLIWPPDFDVRMNNDAIEIVDRTVAKRAVWRIGEVVTLGGGEVYRINDGERPLFSANCLGPYWIVGDVVVPPTVTPAVNPMTLVSPPSKRQWR